MMEDTDSEYWNTLASLGYIPLDHGVWSFNILLNLAANSSLRNFASMFISEISLYFILVGVWYWTRQASWDELLLQFFGTV